VELPDSFSQLSKLRHLDLYHNKLTELTPFLQQVDRFDVLDLNHVCIY
jgi:Leucine-rich repeat (LRR) protein